MEIYLEEQVYVDNSFLPVNSVLSHVQCFMMYRVFLVKIARVSERLYPMDIVVCCSVCLCGDCCYVFNLYDCFAGRGYLYMWWTVFIVRLYNTT